MLAGEDLVQGVDGVVVEPAGDRAELLQAYRREMFARWETALAQVLAEGTAAPPGAAEPFVAAAAIVAVLRAGFEAQTRGAELAEHNSLAALDLLTRGLAGYAPAPPPPRAAPPDRSSGPAV